MGIALPVEGADDADAAQTLADQVVLLVALLVGDFPQMLDPAAQKQAGGDQQRHGAEDHEREREVLAHAEDDAADKHQRDDEDAAAEHRDRLVQSTDVMGGTGDQIGGADAAQLRERHGVHFSEKGGAEIPGVAADDVIDHPVSARDRGKAQQRQPEHPSRGLQDVAEGVSLRRAVDALVQHVGHQRRQQQVAGGRYGHQQRGEGDLASVGFEVG